MANSPIQIVLNSNNFIGAWERPPGGSVKEFYEGRDSEFVAHKQLLTTQLSEIKSKLIENEFADVAYVKLVLNQSALAKSHRPTKRLFKKGLAPVVGGGDLGELFVEVQPDSIDEIAYQISLAEDKSLYKEKDGKQVPNPSKLRSEVGAIDKIASYTASDKRKFSVSEGLEWISNPQTGGAYIIELFETPPPRHDWDNLSPHKYQLFKTFVDGLIKFGSGLVASRLVDNNKDSAMIGVRLEDSSAPANIQLQPSQSSVRRQRLMNQLNTDQDKHAVLIEFLDKHPLVKKIMLPPVIFRSPSANSQPQSKSYTVPSLKTDKSYPKVGVVDGGISTIFKDWVAAKYGFLSAADADEAHGTFIAGLLLSGNSLNGSDICKELDGCKIIDLDLLPKEEHFQSYYNNKPLEFFKELSLAVEQLTADTGVRVFNFSLNIKEHVSSDGYSPAAKMLDKIAEENDVIFVISAGNIHSNDTRREWPSNPTEALSILASSRNDIIRTPAESCRNLSVAAVNPPNLRGVIAFAPANYSCRGPGIRIGIKPDLAHVGGAGKMGTGLFSIGINGAVVDGCGTSYATPNVAKTLACLDHEIEGDVSRETLMALALHHTAVPEVLTDRKLKNVVKNLVGFGIPSSSKEILDGSDHSITLVFANRIKHGKKMSFKFTWPPSLVQNGKCRGHARLTIVSTPPFDYRYGAEFVRVNIEAHLRQEDKDGNYKGRLAPIYTPDSGENQLIEKNQIENAFKWSSTKIFERKMKKGVGNSTNWALDVEYLARDGETLPSEGVPFTVLLTISDPEGIAPVFKEMHQNLQAFGVKIADIQTAARVTQRI